MKSKSVENILLLDTSNERTSIAYFHGNDLIVDESLDGHRHAERVDALIESLFQEHSLSLSEVHAIAVVAGPGSYTGLRIGVSFAKGLACALNIPLLALDALEALARSENSNSGQWVVSSMDPGRDELFYALLDDRGELILPSTYCKIQDVNLQMLPKSIGIRLTGSGSEKLAEHMELSYKGSPDTFINPLGMYQTAMRLIRDGIFADAVNLEPVYLKSYFFKVAKN